MEGKKQNSKEIEVIPDMIPIYGYVKAWKEKKVEKMPLLGVFNVGYLFMIGYSIYKAIPLVKQGLEALLK
jgi:hypothetical protein